MSNDDKKLIENGNVSLRLAVAGSWSTAIVVTAACAWLYNIDTKLDFLGRSRWTFDMQRAYEMQRQDDPTAPIDVAAIRDKYRPE